MIFFDRSMPRSVVDALLHIRNDVMWLEPHFSHDTKDPAWLAEAGTREWVVITRDKKIRTRPAERRAIVKKNVGAFIIAQRQPLARWDVLKIVVGNLDEIGRLFAETPRPFIFTITSVGIRPYA